MSQLFFFLAILACPLMMVFMMRGMGSGGMTHDMSSRANDDRAKDRRLAELEHEVAELRSSQNEQRFIEAHKQ